MMKLKQDYLDYVDYLEKNDYEDPNEDLNETAVLEISDFLIDNNEDVDFNRIKELCKFEISSNYDCDELLYFFKESYKLDKTKTIELLKTDLVSLYKILDKLSEDYINSL